MSVKYKFSRWDWAAILMAALFVVTTLAVHTIQNFIHANWNAGADHTPKQFHSYEWATLVVLIFQAWIFHRQARISNRQRKLMKGQLAAARAQTKLSKDIFIASHRPKLRIRHVWINDLIGQMVKQPGFSLIAGEPVTGHLIIVNVGSATAIMSRGEYRIVFRKSDGMPPGCYEEVGAIRELGPPTKIEFGDGTKADRTFQPGMSYTVRTRGIVKLGKQEDGTIKLREFADEGWRVFVFGQIVYADSEGRERFVGFCRQSDLAGGFRPIDDPDYEYQD